MFVGLVNYSAASWRSAFKTTTENYCLHKAEYQRSTVSGCPTITHAAEKQSCESNVRVLLNIYCSCSPWVVKGKWFVTFLLVPNEREKSTKSGEENKGKVVNCQLFISAKLTDAWVALNGSRQQVEVVLQPVMVRGSITSDLSPK